jgi:hypothetical protein
MKQRGRSVGFVGRMKSYRQIVPTGTQSPGKPESGNDTRAFLIISHYMRVSLFCQYGCETWSLALREKLKLKIFENKVLTRIFAPKREKVT